MINFFFSPAVLLSLCVSSRCLAGKIAGVCLEMAGACYDSAVLMGATPSFLFMECQDARFLLSGSAGYLSFLPKLPPFSLFFYRCQLQCCRQNPLCICPERKLITEMGGEGKLGGKKKSSGQKNRREIRIWKCTGVQGLTLRGLLAALPSRDVN